MKFIFYRDKVVATTMGHVIGFKKGEPTHVPPECIKEVIAAGGMPEDEAMAMIVRGFVEPIAKELPMEYALELNRLIELQMEGSVG